MMSNLQNMLKGMYNQTLGPEGLCNDFIIPSTFTDNMNGISFNNNDMFKHSEL